MPAPLTAPLRAQLRRGGLLAPSVAADTEAARRAIDEREVYAALIPGPAATDTSLVAPAASAAVADLLPKALAKFEPDGRRLSVDVVKPLPASDPRGGFALAVYAVVSGLLGTLLVQDLIGVLQDNTLALAAVGALVVFPTGAATAALQALAGVFGTALAILPFVALGNPASGVPLANELLMPGLWRVMGGLLPPGAGTTLVRNVTYFDENALAGPLLVLAAYAVAGSVVTVADTQPDHDTPGRDVGRKRHAKTASCLYPSQQRRRRRRAARRACPVRRGTSWRRFGD